MSNSKNKGASATAERITGADLKKGAKFGYRLIKSVDTRNVTYVNTNGCKPSNKPSVEHTVTRGEFLAMVND